MPGFGGSIQELGRPRDWAEAVWAFVAEHGKGASRWIAGKFGISQRTAQRWIKGQQAPSGRRGKPGPADVVAAGNRPRYRMRIAARALRNAQAISVGKVRVVSRSSGAHEGTRGLGTLDVDDQLGRELDGVAAALERDDLQGADEQMSNALLGAYGEAQGEARDFLPSVLVIDEYLNGIDVA